MDSRLNPSEFHAESAPVMYGQSRCNPSRLTKKPTLWDQRMEKACREGPLPAEDLQKAFEELNAKTIGMELLDRYQLTYSHPEFKEHDEEENDKLDQQKKRVLTGLAEKVSAPRRANPQNNSSKLQISVQDGVWDLLNYWAASENRDLSGVAAFALEAGIRALKAEGSIPQSAVDAYEAMNRRRLAHSQARADTADFISDISNFPF